MGFMDTENGAGSLGSGVAVYKKIEGDLRRRIQEGQWSSGEMLPSRRVLAKHYGVSPLTVERAVSGLISEGFLRADDRRGTFVAALVRHEAVSQAPSREATDERHHAPAASHRHGRSATAASIGIVGSLYMLSQDHLELNNYWVRQLVQSLEHTATQDGNASRFFNRVQGPDGPVTPLGDAVGEAVAAGMDAIAVIGIGASTPEIEAALGMLDSLKSSIPCVFVSSDSALDRPVPHVFYDNYGAGYQAARHLLAAGHREIVVFSPQTAAWVQARISGIQTAVQHAGLPADCIRVAPGDPVPWSQMVDPEQLSYTSARAYLTDAPVPACVVCLQDQGAFGFIRAAAEAGLTCGQDYAIIGFDDHPQSRAHQLTSMRPPIETMGKEAARLLRKALQGDPANQQIALQWNVIARASSIAHLP